MELASDSPAPLLRRSLDQWFERHDLKPQVIAEFEDSALLEVFASNVGANSRRSISLATTSASPAANRSGLPVDRP